MQITQTYTWLSLLLSIFLLPFMGKGTNLDSLRQVLSQSDSDTNKVQLLLDVSRGYAQEGAVRSSLPLAEEALLLASELEYLPGEQRAILYLGNIYFELGVLDTARHYFNQYLQLCSGPSELQCKVNAYNNLALIHHMHFQLDSSLAMYQKSLKIAEGLQDTVGLALVSSNIGIIFGQQGRLGKALTYFEKSRAFAKALNDTEQELVALSNIGRAYVEKEEHATAQTYLDEALELARKLEDQEGIARIFNFLGISAAKQNQSELAMDYYQRARHLFEQLDAQSGMVEVDQRIADVYLKKGAYRNAITFCEKTLEVGERNGLNEFVEACYKILAESYSHLAQYDKAFTFSEKYIKLHDSLFSKTMQKRMAEMETRFETEKKEAENAYLKVQTAQQQNIIQQRTYLAWAIGAILLLVGVLAWVFFRNSQRVKVLNQSLEKIVDDRTKALQVSNQKLVEKNNELKSFAYIASHDMKEPIRNISVFASLAERNVKDHADPETLELFESIKSNTVHMHTLVQDVLAFSTLADKQIQTETIDLNVVMNKVVFSLDQLIKDKRATIQYANLPTLRSSRAQLFLILKNLVENGVKYNESDKPTVEVCYENSDGMHHLSVRDNGIGIPADYHEKVFEIFKRLHNREKYQGTGIGLAICKKIINRLGGRIEVESEMGKGTIFHCFIPVK